MKKKICKSLTPEQKAALANAKALINEIESMEMGEGEGTEQEMEEAEMALNEKDQIGEQPEGEEPDGDEMKKDDDEDTDVDDPMNPVKVVKKTISTMGSPDAGTSTADDDAEEREEKLPEETKENLDSVAKTLAKLVKAIETRRIAKSKNTDTSLSNVLVGLTKVVKSLQADQAQQRIVLSDILDGLKLSKPIEQNYQSAVQKSKRPVQTTDTNAVLMEVTKALQSISNRGDEVTKTASVEGNSHTVRKSLAENLEALLKY
jgi:hypothetical protein